MDYRRQFSTAPHHPFIVASWTLVEVQDSLRHRLAGSERETFSSFEPATSLEESELLIGPAFTRELTTTPRLLRLYVTRAGYVAALFALVATVWLILSQNIRGLGDLARFGSAVFSVVALIQWALAAAFSALLTAAAVAQEKDRRTLELLLMTNLTSAELVLGKLLASLWGVLMLIMATLPLFMLLALWGGISYDQIWQVECVTLTTAVVAGSLGSTIALWRESTFQSLAMTALLLVLALIVGEAIAEGKLGQAWLGIETQHWATVFSPMRAIGESLQPLSQDADVFTFVGGPVKLHLLVAFATAVVLSLWAIVRVRVWNPAQQAQPNRRTAMTAEVVEKSATQASAAPGQSKRVWDNPVLWREMRTWAYGKKILVVRIAYLLVFGICTMALVGMMTGNNAAFSARPMADALAKPLVPLMMLGLVLVNALAVTSLTNERDRRALDLLLVTDLSPKEIVFGKLGGVFYNSKELILLPMGLCFLIWHYGHMTSENLVFLLVATLVMNAFVAVVGIHVGLAYSDSRSAVGVSLSTVLFLLLGIVVCMRMMVAFEGSFSRQLQAFCAFMVGGGAALYLALGHRNPSGAIGLASFAAPFLTFFAITSFLTGGFGAAFLVTVATYGFATTALLVPAIDEFDVATDRTTSLEG